MQSFNFIKRIKFYSVLSFLVPLIAINSCFALYKFLGNFNTFLNFYWEKEKIQMKHFFEFHFYKPTKYVSAYRRKHPF